MAQEKSLYQQMQSIRARETLAMRAVIAYARSLEPALRDANLNNQADRLAALLGDCDTCEHELKELFMADPHAMIEMVTKYIERDQT